MQSASVRTFDKRISDEGLQIRRESICPVQAQRLMVVLLLLNCPTAASEFLVCFLHAISYVLRIGQLTFEFSIVGESWRTVNRTHLNAHTCYSVSRV